MKIYTKKYNCCGCRLCEKICPTQSITMLEDEKGFIYPTINETTCVNCGKCGDFCQELEKDIKSNFCKSFAAKNKNENIRNISSSGGMFLAFAQKIINWGGVVFGAVFNEELKVVHTKAENIDEVLKMKGSKYVQSDTVNTFEEVQNALEDSRWVLYSGTPCQIAALKLFLSKEYERLILVSVICYGVPSPKVWSDYISFCKKTHMKSPISKINFREKLNGNVSPFFSVRFEDEHLMYNVDYLYGFSKNLFLRPSCYNCKVKPYREVADIVIGDYWGVDNYHNYFNDNKGISAVIIHSEKGDAFFKAINEIDYIDSEYKKILNGNPFLCDSVKLENQSKHFWNTYNQTGDVISSIYTASSSSDAINCNRSNFMYKILLKYLKNKLSAYSLEECFVERDVKRIALYAINEVSSIIMCDLKESNKVNISCICDKRNDEYRDGYNGIYVTSIKELSEMVHNNLIDEIYVCNIQRYKDIKEELVTYDIPVKKIFSVSELVSIWEGYIIKNEKSKL